MDIQQILALFDREQRIEIEYPGTRKELLPDVIRFLRPMPGMSFIMYSRLDEANADSVIQEQIDFFKGINSHFEWKVYGHDQPADLVERLVSKGLEAEESEAVMVLDLHEAPESLLSPITADVRQLTGREQLRDVIRLEEQVWGEAFEWIMEWMGGHMEIPGYLSVYVAYVDGEPTCTGWTYYQEGSSFASLWGGSTVESYRKQGLYTAVLAARVQEVRDRGVRFLTIDAGPMSQPIVARHGFRVLTSAYGCEWKG